ncbi:hypothetical protein JCGZ_09184 [Jatropha curcas]|uniref:GIR1-like zinc ribbon domain-containing protein n=1 Tax=Jatropha curcas TaxID=180498 RepID=A0A067KF90_JATCU|nr:uncharacterized protein LOC105636818 [Jatropha curcas]KDP34896.1 hypothetical protein JCGZ_09184 [Jatropha curcas]
MAADVSSIVKSGNSEILITRDLLGGLSKVGSSSKDLDLDLKTGALYTQRYTWNSPNSPSSSFKKKSHKQKEPNAATPPLKFLEESSCLELKLLPSSSQSYCESVCTLDKVKSALRRAEKEETVKKRFSFSPPPSQIDEQEGSSSSNANGMFAAGCPGCLMYIMTLKTNPKCPNCNSAVPLLPLKKPRIDLNA